MCRQKDSVCVHSILYQTIPQEVTNALSEDLNECITIDVVAMLDQIGFLETDMTSASDRRTSVLPRCFDRFDGSARERHRTVLELCIER